MVATRSPRPLAPAGGRKSSGRLAGGPGPVVARPVLEAALDGVLTRRLACVVAGAGFGKTTLLAGWASRVQPAWHSLTPADRDVTTLARHLAAVLGERIPTYPAAVRAAVTQARGPGADSEHADALAAVLCDAVRDCARQDVVLVLDDAEILGPDTPAARLVEGVCRQAPQVLHLVLAGRIDPPFRVDRLRIYGDLVEVTAADLAFTTAQTGTVLAATAGAGAAEHAAAVQQATGGWPAAVRLAAEALRDVPPERAAHILDGIHSPGPGPLFDYLAGEVIDREPADVRELVRRAAYLPRLTGEMCTALGWPAAGALASLARRGLFVESRPPGSGTVALLPLVREFAQRSFPLSPAGVRQLHRKAAAWYTQQGAVEDAVISLLTAGEHGRAAEILARHGPAVLAAGSVDAVRRAAAALPADTKDAALWQLEGEALQIRGEWEAARACFTRAAGADGRPRAATAWRLGLIHYLRGEPDEALRVFNRHRPDREDLREEAMLAGWTAAARWATGNVAGCRELVARALDLAETCGDPQALALAHTTCSLLCVLDGDRAGNERHCAQALEYADRAGDALQLIRIRTNRASHLMEEGDYRAALVELDAVLPTADVTGFIPFHALGLHNRGDTYRCLGRIEEAVADLTTARRLYERVGSDHACRPLRALGDLYRERGDLALAVASYTEAAKHAEACGDARSLVLSWSGLARALAEDEPARAAEWAEQALARATGPARTAVILAAGWAALGRGERSRAAELATEAVGEARRHRDRAALADSLELRGAAAVHRPGQARRLLTQAVSLWHDLGNPLGEARARLALARLVDGAGRRRHAELAAVTARTLGAAALGLAAADVLGEFDRNPPTPVTLRVLGEFQLLRGGRPVPAAEWQSRKARDLVKILVSRRGRPASRAGLMAALWPDEDADRLGNRFSVALSTARSVLDPAKAYGPDHLVIAEDGAVRLDAERVEVDVERFLADAEAGFALRREGRATDAAERMIRAEAAYRGDVLEADVYSDWAIPLREEARATYVRLARALATDARLAGEHDAAIRLLLRVLERDRFDEPAHLDLVRTLAAAGRHGEARRRYREYAARMAEIDVEAAAFPAG
jgi:ATP/maltotriose-dependent transcriptional regulator MalT/DNA-binding SARP family transcriptional activator